ncbi:MAG: HEAT repeat domain-containing protein [Verrucomicrobia bacterium]|nr:HEAT repeat domain-containing protein [Verrucomicrobiota bacterium]MBU1734475.1 HEAT repeat domain-containing protein [Verrucomicrobiota bacterium]MBU1856061.1 HEAT repeat domain-containing protein [Verrucomicrobiota bacterium]
MQKTMNSARVLLFLLIMSARCFASGYYGDLADAWGNASIIVLGRPQIITTSIATVTVLTSGEAFERARGTYVMDIQRTYKGAKLDGRIEFIDPHFRSTAALHIQKGEMYLVFLQTRDDRTKRPHPAEEGLGEAISGLRVFKVDDRNLAEIEAGIATVRTYETLAPPDRKAFLLQNLVFTNAYSHSLIVREILHAGIKEALPYFQQRLSQTTNETDRLDLLSTLRCLGDPSVKAILLSWLADDSFQNKSEIIRDLAFLKDPSLVPTIRKYIDVKDDRVAVSARIALLDLGESDGKRLLLDMIKRSRDPIARYNAIHQLNFGYSGNFTDKEKEIIRELVHDKDQTIARVAGFIVKKWKPMSKPLGNGEIPAHSNLMEIKISSFEIKDLLIREAVRKLAEEAHLLCCFESMPENHPQWWAKNGLLRKLSVAVNNATPREVLDKFAELSDNTWYWEEWQGVINIIPKERQGASNYFLNRIVSSFHVEDMEFPDAICLLIKQTGEKPGYGIMDRPGNDNSPVNIDVKNLTVRQILDTMTTQTGRTWELNVSNFLVLFGKSTWLPQVAVSD